METDAFILLYLGQVVVHHTFRFWTLTLMNDQSTFFERHAAAHTIRWRWFRLALRAIIFQCYSMHFAGDSLSVTELKEHEVFYSSCVNDGHGFQKDGK